MNDKVDRIRRGLVQAALALPAAGILGLGGARAFGQETGPLRFLILGALTGTGTTFGTGLTAGAQTAIDRINADGGVMGRQIEAIVVDTGTDAAKAAVLFQDQVTSNRPHAAFGAGSTAESQAVVPLAARENIPYFGSTDLIDIIDAEKFPPVFSMQSSWGDVAQIIATQLAEAGVKTIGIMAAIDGTGEGVVKYLPDLVTAAGIDVVGVERFKPTDLDMTNQLRKLDGAAPDIIYVEASGAPSGHILQGLIRLGITRPVICGKAMGASNLESLTDASKLPNVIIFNHAVSNRGPGGRGDIPLVEQSRQSFIDYSGGKLVTSLYIYSWGFDAVHVWATAVKEAQSTETDAIVSQIESWSEGTTSGTAFMSRDNFVYTPELHLPRADPSAYGYAKLGTLNESGTREGTELKLG